MIHRSPDAEPHEPCSASTSANLPSFPMSRCRPFNEWRPVKAMFGVLSKPDQGHEAFDAAGVELIGENTRSSVTDAAFGSSIPRR